MKITKLLCPSCEGSGDFSLLKSFDVRCTWCKGAKRVPVETGLRYADHIYMIAGGGYVAGDHDYEHKIEMENKAGLIYKTACVRPPWLKGGDAR